jgi:uncharacterized membrane protein YedE/YeeE
VRVWLLFPSFLLAVILGFAAHRASLCTVKAVAELLSSRRAAMLLSFGKTVLWVLAVTWLLQRIHPIAPAMSYPLSLTNLLGGLVFGVGAAVNGGCSISILNRLGSGELGMLATLIGLGAGLATVVSSVPRALPVATASTMMQGGGWSILLLIAVWSWALWETWRLGSRRPGVPLRERILSHRYRLSTAAALMGLSGGLLFALHGRWTYTSQLRSGVRWFLDSGSLPAVVYLALFAAMLAGVVLSAWQRGAFRLRGPSFRGGLRHLFGGFLMGGGVALVPGGNDALILHAIPRLLAYALPAYLAMLAGTALTLMVMSRLTGRRIVVACEGDVCTDD